MNVSPAKLFTGLGHTLHYWFSPGTVFSVGSTKKKTACYFTWEDWRAIKENCTSVLDGNSIQKDHILKAQQANVYIIPTIKVVKIPLS